MKARKRAHAVRYGLILYRFNGAAPLKARKQGKIVTERGVGVELQWGRAVEGAETG